MNDKIIVDQRPAYFWPPESDERIDVDTKRLRQLQWAMNCYIDEICTGEHTGIEVQNFEGLLEILAQDEFDLCLISMTRVVLEQASRCRDGYVHALHALISVSRLLAEGYFSGLQLCHAFSSSDPRNVLRAITNDFGSAAEGVTSKS